jgi:hypothetical protein
MIDHHRLGKISCDICGEVFVSGSRVCTIASREFSLTKMGFTTNTVEVCGEVDNDERNLILPRELNFHQSCFEIIAGKDYTP